MAGSNSAPQSVVLRFDEAGGSRAVVLEDDGRVAYAYLLEKNEIVGDVWLYNVADSPEAVDWSDRSAMPFANPKRYCATERLPRLTEASNVRCSWSDRGVDIAVEGIDFARVEHGSKPGWSRLAAVPGPLANPLRPRE
jgi:hypothetical protein